ncbi:VOC domain-containing protein YaeR [Tenacibaculum sp. 190524A05c]|uniref:SMU1112c/YaeR family gloxylase I-like metalloprotein n=1 Tax=Tenacibaculum platacis TaxID=3137852 RepID=UPI0031FB7B30
MKIDAIHHIAIICSDYDVSKRFYTQILGFKVEQEVYRKERSSYKLDLSLHGTYVIELFSFPNPPKRASFPEATGLRHIAFGVRDLKAWKDYLESNNVSCQEIRIDEFTGKQFFFFIDPDNLPIELYEI